MPGMDNSRETRSRFAAIMLGVAENFGQTISPVGGELRFKALQNFSLAEIEAAAMTIIASRKYTSMPTVADFLEHLGGGSVEDKAEIEAGKVLEAIARVGGYNTVVFDDPTTMAVIQNAHGGWAKLCADCGVEESEKWFRINFAKTWAAYRRQGIQAFGSLPGKHEIANTASGQFAFIPAPRLIVDKHKAQKVLEMGPQEAPRQLSAGASSFEAAMHSLVPAEDSRSFDQ